MGATVALRNDILDKIFKDTDFTISDTYISLHTADPGDTGASEVSGGTYARQLVEEADWNAAASALLDNVNDVDFNDMPATTVTHVGVWNASTAGTFLWGGALDASKTTSAGDTIRLPAGDLDIQIT